MEKVRIVFLAVIVAAGSAAGYLIYSGKLTTPRESTLAPAYQLAGRTTSLVSRALTKVIPVDSLDEKEFGDAIAMSYEYQETRRDARYRYVNDLMGSIARYRKKPFHYRVYVIGDPSPNACAFPGGVILVTEGLLATMKSEAEVMAVLAHEMGHVELSHCLDTVRFRLLAQKVGSASMGTLADMAVNILARHTYSKTQEDDADSYAYAMVLNTAYNPSAVGGAFGSFLSYQGASGDINRREHAGPLREYLMTHPHLEHRMEKYSEKARIWWQRNQGARKYNGKKNLLEMKAFLTGISYPGEWTTRP
jgi:predicted Zn-dependent protease